MPGGAGALHAAIAAGDAEAVRTMLLKLPPHQVNRPTQGFTPLMRAAWENRPAVVGRLLSAPDIGVNDRDDQGATALHHAAAKGSVEMVRMLVERGAESAMRDDDGRTASDRAAVSEHTAVVELLSGWGHGS